MSDPLQRDALGYLHPATEADVARLLAESTGPVRVRGAAHSVPGAIHSDAWLRGDRTGATELILDRLRTITLDLVRHEVTVGAGVRFGHDPLDTYGLDPAADGLLAALDASGRALINVGGIAHQTVVGFLATGSSGGSTRHDLHADVCAIRLVDARGTIHELRPGDPAFDAGLVHLGLLGVVTAVTLRTHPRYDLVGSERTLPAAGGDIDLYADGPTSLAAFLERTPYARVLWWPQRGVDSIVAWEARPATTADGPGAPWTPMPAVLGSSLPMQAAAGAALLGLARWRSAVARVAPRALAPFTSAVAPLSPHVYRAVLGPPRREFRGSWHTTLPLDRDMSDRLLPTTFTEIWIPLDRAAEALRRLRAVFDAPPEPGSPPVEGPAAGRFAIELYAGPPATGWLAPGYGGPRLRINPFWFEGTPGDPRDHFFPRIWAALADLDPRLHWGKLLPHEPATFRLAARFPRLPDFAALRAELDPDERFLTDTFRLALGLTRPLGGTPARPASPLPRNRRAERLPAVAGPLPFRLAPSDASLIDRADLVFRLEATSALPPEAALRAFFPPDRKPATRWAQALQWRTPPGELDHAVFDERLVFMGLRMHVVHHEPARRLVVSVDRCTWPLAREMVEVVEVEPEGSGSRVRWIIALTAPAALRPLAPLLAPPFRAMFTSILAGIAGGAP